MAAPPPADDLYAILGVTDTASHMTVSQAYRDRMRAVHPDVVGDTPGTQERAARVNAAWAVLRDPVRRASYDRARSARLSGSPVSDSPISGDGVVIAAGVRVVTPQQLREAATRNSAYGQLGLETRAAFGRASLRFGWIVMAVGALVLAAVLRA